MAKREPIWLVYNDASGSNDKAAQSRIEAGLESVGFEVKCRTCFPQEHAPDAGHLDRKGIGTLCVFAGDGTVNAVVSGLFGWRGRVLVLPGGTMNLLSRRLHGEADAPRILARIERSRVQAMRPPVLRNRHGVGLTGALLGPGTAWGDVREAIRDVAIGSIATTMIDAAAESLSGCRVTCTGLEDVRPEGYAAVSINPCESGIAVRGYFAEGPFDVTGQLVAMLRGDFRDGPHDWLGHYPSIEIASSGNEPMGLLIDGEPREAGIRETFTATLCEVDLLATGDVA